MTAHRHTAHDGSWTLGAQPHVLPQFGLAGTISLALALRRTNATRRRFRRQHG